MAQFIPQRLALWTKGNWQGPRPAAISGFANDTRTLKLGECFVALQTNERTGHDYLQEAKERGASAAIVQYYQGMINLPQLIVRDSLVALQAIAREYRLAFPGTVIGVTGSCGKTSTKDLLHLLLGKDETFKTRDNLNNCLGLPLMLTQLQVTQHRAAILEAGINEPQEMAILGGVLQPDIGLVTMVAPVHLEKLGSVDDVARYKALLLKAVRPGGLKVFPAEVLQYEAFRELEGPGIVLVKQGQSAAITKPGFRSVVFEVEILLDNQIALRLKEAGKPEHYFTLKYVSAGMAQNAALALTLAVEMGVSDSDLQERLQAWQPSDLRGQIFEHENQWVYADCYNANPVAMVDAFCAFDAQAATALPRLYLIGGMNELGNEAARYHYETGLALNLRPMDCVCLIGPYAMEFRDGLLAAGAMLEQIEVVEDLEQMRAVFEAFEGAIFLKGSKGFKLWTLLRPTA